MHHVLLSELMTIHSQTERLQLSIVRWKILRTLDFKDIALPRNSIILLRTWVFTETYSKKIINRDDRCSQWSFSTPLYNMNSVEDENKNAGPFYEFIWSLGELFNQTVIGISVRMFLDRRLIEFSTIMCKSCFVVGKNFSNAFHFVL